jgi:hypothetical protein
MRIFLGIISGLLFAQIVVAQPAARLIAASGQAARDTQGRLTNVSFYASMGNWMPPQVDNRGRIFFQTSVQDTNNTPTFNDAYFLGAPRREGYVMRERQGFPTITNTLTFGTIDQPKFTRGGSLAFKTFLGGSGAGSVNTRDALIAGSANRLDIIARKGSLPDFMLFPDDGGGGIFFNYDYLQSINTFEIFSSDYVLFDFSTVTNQSNNNGFSSRALMLYSPAGYSLVYKSGMQAPGRFPAELYTQTLRAYTMQSPGNIAWAATYSGDRIGVWRAAPILAMQILDHGDVISTNRFLRDVSNLWLTRDGASMYVLAAAEDDALGGYFAWALGRERHFIDPVTSNRTPSFTWLGEDHRPVPGRPDLIFTNSVDGQWGSGSSFQQAGFDLFENGDMLVYTHAATNGGAISKEMIFRVVDTNFVELISQGNAAPGGGSFSGFASVQAMGSNHVMFIAATMRSHPNPTTYDLWYMRAEPGATPVKLLGQGDVFRVASDDERAVEFIHQFSANRHGDVAASVSFTNFTSGLIYIHAPGIAAPPVILSETLVDGFLPLEIPLGIPGYRLMEATNLLGDWVASSIIPEGADESIRWEIPLDTPGRYFRFEPEE